MRRVPETKRGLARQVAELKQTQERLASALAGVESMKNRLLEENARWFRQYPNATIIIEGHCDERGTEEYNLALGDRRAQRVRTYLVQLGIAPDRMRAISFGEERPFARGYDEAAYRLNRRVHFLVRR